MKHDIESHNFTGVHTDHDEHAKKAKQTATAVGLVKVVYTPTAEGHTDSKHTPSFEVYADGEKLAEWKEAGASTNGVWSVVEGKEVMVNETGGATGKVKAASKDLMTEYLGTGDVVAAIASILAKGKAQPVSEKTRNDAGLGFQH